MHARLAIAALICLMPALASAQVTRSETICWGEYENDCTSTTRANDPPMGYGPKTVFMACGSGGHSGFNPPWVCQQICGSSEPSRCNVWTNDNGGWPNGRCDYQWARVTCYR